MRVYLQTERLVLRRFTPDDAENLFDLDNDPEVMRFLTGGRTTPRGVIESEVMPGFLRYYERFERFGYWAALEKSSGEFVGWFALHPPNGDDTSEVELGYRLRRSAWGKGYATEGSRAVLDKGFRDPGVRRVFARTMAVNFASRRVMEKVGMSLVRTFHEEWDEPIAGAEHGEVEYALIKCDQRT